MKTVQCNWLTLQRDSLYRIVAHAVSDVNGKFAFKLVNPANRLSVTYVEYWEAVSEFTGSFFEIKMVETNLPTVDLIRDAKRVTMYGPPAVNYNRYYDPNVQPAVMDSIRLDTEYLSTHMRLRNGILPPVSREEFAPLIIYDGNPVEVDKEKYAAFDWEKDIYSKKKVAVLLGVKKKAVKASRVVTDRAAIAIWGSKGRNGTFEVISYDAEEYNRLATNNFFQPLK
jgi:hypothetical protein